MSKLNKLVSFAFVLGSNSVFAGVMGPVCDPGNVTVPCEQRAWDIGAKALYLQSSWGALNFPAAQVVQDNSFDFIDGTNQWKWGFMVEGSYHFSTGNDVNLNWYHIQPNITNTATGSILSTTIGTIFPPGPGPRSFVLEPTWDAVNIEFGQHVDYSHSFSARYFGGFEYAHIDFERRIYGFQGLTPVVAQRNMRYNGFGPRVGVDGTYRFNNGFGLYADGAIGVYAGSTHFHYLSPAPGVGERNGTTMVVVPELEVKTGANYQCSFARGNLSLDAGWMWITYINPMMHADDSKLHSTDFSLQGPYVGFNWVGNFM